MQRPRRPRPQYRAPVGLPKSRENWRVGSVVSALLHLGVLLLLIFPFVSPRQITEFGQGAGGPGPAGGGGGGNRGTGAPPEALTFVRVAPPPAPVIQPKPIPPVTPPTSPLPEPQVTAQPEFKLPIPAITAGSGGGTGSDPAGGSGPGSGGGVGSGIGTGRGSAVGPGTGGGDQPNYPPEPIEMFIPPFPVPESARGFRLVAEFDVDDKGKVLSMTFTETRDRGYNRRLSETLRAFRFRPGTKPDGTPIRMKAQIAIILP